MLTLNPSASEVEVLGLKVSIQQLKAIADAYGLCILDSAIAMPSFNLVDDASIKSLSARSLGLTGENQPSSTISGMPNFIEKDKDYREA